jgi:hypothetical protein
VTPIELLIRQIFVAFAIMEVPPKARIQKAPSEQVS